MGKSKNPLLDKVRKRLKGLQEQNTRTTGLWKPSGEHTVRIVPYKFSDYPFIELYFHWDINEKNYLSPSSFDRPDPFVEYAEKLAATGDREDFLLSRQLRPKMRTYVPVIVRGEENEGVKFWGFGKTIYEDILKIMNDDEYGDISDPETGTDLVVTFIPKEEAGNNYGKTSVRAKRNSSPLSESEEMKNKFLNNQKEITEIYKELSYDDLKEVLEKWILDVENGEDDEKTETEETQEAGDDVVEKGKDAFKDLFEVDDDKKK